MKNLKIVAVRPVLNAKDVKPMIIFDVVGYERGVVRIPKMALIDLHNSGRALNIPERAFDGAPQHWNRLYKSIFLRELHKCKGAIMEGDITPVKEGDKYIADANSTAVKEKKAKIGQTLTVQKDGMRVQGFLTISLTEQEEQILANADAYALGKLAFFDAESAFGGDSGSSSNGGTNGFDPENDDFEDFGTKTPMKEATGK